jgi:hypothetical protein
LSTHIFNTQVKIKNLLFFCLLFFCGFIFAQKPCSYLPTKLANDNLIADLMQIKNNEFKTILDNPKKYEIQIIYTQVNHTENGLPELIQHQYQLNLKQYFYPASLVKLPLSAFALEKCNLLNIPSNASMITLANHHCQTEVSVDSSSLNYNAKYCKLCKKNDVSER